MKTKNYQEILQRNTRPTLTPDKCKCNKRAKLHLILRAYLNQITWIMVGVVRCEVNVSEHYLETPVEGGGQCRYIRERERERDTLHLCRSVSQIPTIGGVIIIIVIFWFYTSIFYIRIMTEFPSLNLAEMEELLDIENLSLYFNCSDRKVLTNSIKIRRLINLIDWPIKGTKWEESVNKIIEVHLYERALKGCSTFSNSDYLT